MIRFCQQVGFSLAEVSALLTPETGKQAKEKWRQLVDSKVTQLDALIEQTQAVKKVLAESRDCDCLTLGDCSFVRGRRTALAFRV